MFQICQGSLLNPSSCPSQSRKKHGSAAAARCRSACDSIAGASTTLNIAPRTASVQAALITKTITKPAPSSSTRPKKSTGTLLKRILFIWKTTSMIKSTPKAAPVKLDAAKTIANVSKTKLAARRCANAPTVKTKLYRCLRRNSKNFLNPLAEKRTKLLSRPSIQIYVNTKDTIWTWNRAIRKQHNWDR